MARLRWMENSRFGEEGTTCTHDNKLFFDDENAYINASATGALALNATTVTLTATTVTVSGNLDITGSITYGSEVVSLNQNLMGTLDVGVNDTGFDVTFYGATTGNYLLWDESADDLTLVGTATQFAVAGTTDASSETTGSIHTAGGIGLEKALWVGTTSQLVGDVTIVGATTCAALSPTGAVTIVGAVSINGDVTMHEDHKIIFYDGTQYIQASDNATLNIAGTAVAIAGVTGITGATTITGNLTIAGAGQFVSGSGALTITGAINSTKAITISPTAAGTFLDFALETEWVSGTLINADCASGTTFSDDVVGMLLDFDTNVTATAGKDIIGYQVKFTGLDTATSTTFTGFDLPTADAIDTSSTATFTWKGVNLQLPNSTEGGTATNSYGVYVATGTVTSGEQYGVYLTGTFTEALYITGTLNDAAGRAVHSVVTVDAPNYGDGYGANEFDLTTTGTVAGHTACASFWVNTATGVTGTGNSFLTPLSLGIYEASAASMVNTTVVLGARIQGVLGDTNADNIAVFSLACSGDTLDALWLISAPDQASYAASAAADGTKLGGLPFFKDSNGEVYWIRLYESAI